MVIHSQARKELNEERRLQEQLLHTVEEQQSLLDIMATVSRERERECIINSYHIWEIQVLVVIEDMIL